jgi:hypothetical protein
MTRHSTCITVRLTIHQKETELSETALEYQICEKELMKLLDCGDEIEGLRNLSQKIVKDNGELKFLPLCGNLLIGIFHSLS